MTGGTFLGPLSAGLGVLWPFGHAPRWDFERHPRLDRVGGVPRLRLDGDDTARGRAHGEAAAPQILALFEHALRPFLGSPRTSARFRSVARRYAEHLRDDERAEMAAIAAAAGVEEERVLLGNTFVDAHKVVLCSTVITRDRATGRRLIGRNLDFPCLGIAHRLSLVTTHAPAGALRHATIGWPGLAGAFSGLNEAGVGLFVNLAYGADDCDDGLPVVFHVRRVLRAARDLDDVEAILRDAPHATANNLTAADRSGRAAIFEVGPAWFRRRDADEGGFACATNHFLPPGRARVSPLGVTSRFRVAALCRHPARSRAGVRRALRRVGIPFMNLQSMILDPQARAIDVSVGSFAAARRAPVTFGPRELRFG